MTFRSFIYWMQAQKRSLDRRGFPAINNLFHSAGLRNSHTQGELAYDSAEIVHKGFAYLMNNHIDGDYAKFGILKVRQHSKHGQHRAFLA